jgi:hypothetical protein
MWHQKNTPSTNIVGREMTDERGVVYGHSDAQRSATNFPKIEAAPKTPKHPMDEIKEVRITFFGDLTLQRPEIRKA